MNPVPTLEEEEEDDLGEPHTFSNKSSSYTEALHVHLIKK
jgi:hypothetical protein